MDVLLADFDLFRTVGGGQTIYRSIILRNPHINFSYLRRAEPEDVRRPPNARAVPFQTPYEVRPGAGEVTTPLWVLAPATLAGNVARSVAGRSFDVIDVPDYLQFGAFLRPALERHGVTFDRVALSMHGGLSTTNALNRGVAESWLQRLEVMHYAAADTRVFISEMYRDEWRALSGLASCYVDPMWFISFGDREPFVDREGPPDLHFIGRVEKRKGPHLFLQLAWWAARDLYRGASVIGPDDMGPGGDSALNRLKAMAALRRDDVHFPGCLTPAELSALFAAKSVTVLPSVYDTLNLTALESLFSGCPTMIGCGAGVCRYLRERFPEIPFEVFDVRDLYANVPKLESLLSDYRRRRDELEAALERIDVQPRGLGLEETYRATPSFDPAVRVELEQWYEQVHEGPTPVRQTDVRPHLRRAG